MKKFLFVFSLFSFIHRYDLLDRLDTNEKVGASVITFARMAGPVVVFTVISLQEDAQNKNCTFKKGRQCVEDCRAMIPAIEENVSNHADLLFIDPCPLSYRRDSIKQESIRMKK
ncbi:MAG: hypothetical protein ACI35R_10785 [Bacillus sp. (in: firmicutes)]